MIDVAHPTARFRQAIGDGAGGIAAVVFLAREPLFLGGRDDASVLDQRRGAVVIERGNAENTHAPPLRAVA